jgi:phosphate:Na+ symporter
LLIFKIGGFLIFDYNLLVMAIEVQASAMFLLGLGLLLTGINILSESLKRIGSRTFRILSMQYLNPRWKALVFGLGAGAALQSTSAALFILGSLNSAGSVTVAQAISILTGFSVGNCILPFLVSIKIRFGVFFVVGISAIMLYFTKVDTRRNLWNLAFGLGLIFFGIEMLLDGVRPLRQEPWFSETLRIASAWPGLSILIGMAFGFLVQSSTTVVMVAIGLAKGGVLPVQETFLIMYGAAVGSTGFKTFLGSAMSGSGRQLVRFVNYFNFTGAGVFVILFYVEKYLHIPLVLALLAKITPEPEIQAAWAFMLMNLTAAIFYMLIHTPVVGWLAHQFPPAEEEELSKPLFLWDKSPDDSQVALDIIHMEQSREFGQVAALLPSAFEPNRGADLKKRWEALQCLGHEIESAMAEVVSLHLDVSQAQRHAILQNRQTMIMQLAEELMKLIEFIRQAQSLPEITLLANNCFEALDFLIQNASEIVKSGELLDEDQTDLYGDRSTQMRQLRNTFLNSNQNMTPPTRSCLLGLTLCVDKCIWILNRTLSMEYKSL